MTCQWAEELLGHDVSCKTCSSLRLEVLSQEFVVLRHVKLGALQDDVYLNIFTSCCVPDDSARIYTFTTVLSVNVTTA